MADHIYVPGDILTKTAILLVKVGTGVLMILTPLEIITTSLGGCLIALTFGVFALVLSLIWWPFFMFLLGTSWLWLHCWYLRPILLVPGVLVAILADLYVMLAPEPEKEAKIAKLSIAGEWPLSWYLTHPGPLTAVNQQEINELAMEADRKKYEAEQDKS